jgi:glycosyltransferase involved in cell wall biosynthesis
MPKVSVIIPVFGVEQSIERCAQSLFDQTLDDIEYIFVDDCTPDKSIEILKKVIRKYPLRIEQTRIIKMPTNTGLPCVRREGIQLATGDYIIHCDSDDCVDINMYRAMYEKAIEEDSDVVVCDYITTDGTNEKRYFGLCSTVNEQTILDMLFQRVSWSLWNKLFKRKVYSKEITYPKENMAEDMALTMQLMYYCDKISYLKVAFYYYYQNPSSITRTMLPEAVINRFIQACRNAKIVDTFYKTHFLNGKIDNGLIYIKFMQRSLLLPVLNDKKYFKVWLNTFPEINLKVFFCSQISIKERFKFFLTFLRLYPR